MNMYLERNTPNGENLPREGDLYCVVKTFGRSFELRYGYYDDRDRSRPPDVIYPDFLQEPIYTEKGEPFVTMMQDACRYYRSERVRHEDSLCSECEYFVRGEEWFGICSCPMNTKRKI